MKRTIDFRYVIVRNGADCGTICPDGTPKIKCDRKGQIKTSLSGKFRDTGGVNWLADQIRPEIIIDGVTYSLGVFLPATVRQEETSTQKLVSIEAFDKCWIVRDNYTESILYLQSGTRYLDAINQLLTTCGITLVSQVDNAATLSEAREDWDIGTSYLVIVNQLLSEINYKPLWFDSQGVAILEPINEPVAANIRHTFDKNNIKSLMLPQIKRETDIFQAPNVFICVCNNADKANSMVATSENTNPQSPLSIQRRGRRIAAVYHIDNIADQTELQKYADTLRNQSMIAGEAISITTALLPGFGVGDVVGLLYDDLFTVCIERAWDMRLEVGGEMTHTLDRVVVNLG